MKISKFFALIGIIGFLLVSCEKDPKPTPPPADKETTAKFPVTGTYIFGHGQMAFEYIFTENTFTKPLYPSGTEKANLIAISKNKEGVNKAILKETNGKFAVLFIRNIVDESIEINLDSVTFDTKDKAEKAEYPDPNAKFESHGKMGWFPIVKKK